MNDEELIQLLSREDGRHGRPVLKGDLAGRVLRRARRRKMVRRGVAMAVLLLAAAPLLRLGQRGAAPAPVLLVPTEVHSVDAVVAQKTAEAILRRRHEVAIGRIPADPRQVLEIEMDSTAGFLMASGDEMALNPKSAALAADNFRRIEVCFPGTRWAAEAERRLREMHS